jgi:hypothetical protein
LGESDKWWRRVTGTWMWRLQYMWDVGMHAVYSGIVHKW